MVSPTSAAPLSQLVRTALSTPNSQPQPPSISETWKTHQLNDIKRAIQLLIQEGLLTEDLQPTFTFDTLDLKTDDKNELDALLKHPFPGKFNCSSIIKSLIKSKLPISNIQIIGGSIPLSNAYLLRLLDQIRFKSADTKALLKKIIEQRSREWNDLDIRIKFHQLNPGEEKKIIQFLKTFFQPHPIVHQAPLNNNTAYLFSLGQRGRNEKLDLIFQFDPTMDPYMFTSDSAVVEILPHFTGGRPFPISNSCSLSHWMIHRLLNVTCFDQDETVLDKTFLPKYICQRVKGTSCPNSHLSQKLYNIYFADPPHPLGPLAILQNSRHTHLPEGADVTLAYWMNAYITCKKCGADKERLNSLAMLLKHERDLSGVNGKIIQMLQNNPEKSEHVIALLKIIALASYFQETGAMTATLLENETYLEYPLNPESPEHTKVLFSMDLKEEMELIQSCADFSEFQCLFDKLPFAQQTKKTKLKDPNDFGLTPDIIKGLAYDQREGLKRFSLFFLIILSHEDNELIEKAPKALLETSDQNIQKNIALALKSRASFFNKLAEWTEQPSRTPSSCYRALLQDVYETDSLREKGVQLLCEEKEIFHTEDLIFLLNLFMSSMSFVRRNALLNTLASDPQNLLLGLINIALKLNLLEQSETLIKHLGETDFPALEKLSNSCDNALLKEITEEFLLEKIKSYEPLVAAKQLLLLATKQENEKRKAVAAQVFPMLLPDHIKEAHLLLLAYHLPLTHQLAEAYYTKGEIEVAAQLLMTQKNDTAHPRFLPQLFLQLIKSDRKKAHELYNAFPFLSLNELIKLLCRRGEAFYAKKFLLQFYETGDASINNEEWEEISSNFFENKNYEAASVATREAGNRPSFKKLHQRLTDVFAETNPRLAEIHLYLWAEDSPEWISAFQKLSSRSIEKLEARSDISPQTKSSCYRFYLEKLSQTKPRKATQLFCEKKGEFTPEDLIPLLNLFMSLIPSKNRKTLLEQTEIDLFEIIRTAQKLNLLKQSETLLEYLGEVNFPELEKLAKSCKLPFLNEMIEAFSYQRALKEIESKEPLPAARQLLSLANHSSDEKRTALAAQVFPKLLPDQVEMAHDLLKAYQLPNAFQLAEAYFKNGESVASADLLIERKREGTSHPTFLPRLFLQLIKENREKAYQLFKAFPFVSLPELIKHFCQNGETGNAKRFLLQFYKNEKVPLTREAWEEIASSFFVQENYEATSKAIEESGEASSFKQLHQKLTKIFLGKENLRLAEFHLQQWKEDSDAWEDNFHQLMDKKVANYPQETLDLLPKEELFPNDPRTEKRWIKVLDKLINQPQAALSLLRKTDHFFSKETREQLCHQMMEAFTKDNSNKECFENFFSFFSKKYLLSAPPSSFVNLIQCAAPDYDNVKPLLDQLTAYYKTVKAQRPEGVIELAPAWNCLLQRLFHKPKPDTDQWFIDWMKVKNFKYETEKEAVVHLKETEFWYLANSGFSPEEHRKFITYTLINLLRLVFQEEKPPKNQIPIIWLAHSLQKSFDSHLNALKEISLPDYVMGEKALIESLIRVHTHEQFKELGRKRIHLFDQVRKGKNDLPNLEWEVRILSQITKRNFFLYSCGKFIFTAVVSCGVGSLLGKLVIKYWLEPDDDICAIECAARNL